MKERIAIVDGIRTPQCKIGTALRTIEADDLGAHAVKELMARTSIPASDIEELIFGNVGQPAHAANIARVIALKAGLPQDLIASTVHRNCASGMESITAAANKILAGFGSVFIAGGTESMSNLPLLFNNKMKSFFEKLMRSKTPLDKLKTFAGFRVGFLAPVIGVVKGLTDPVSGLIMGLTAEVLAKEFHITREEQDEYSLMSHQRAVAAMKAGTFAEEIIPIPVPPSFKKIQTEDVGPREDQSLEALHALKPYFDRKNGTVTVGNSCPLTDGAAAVLVMGEKTAKERGIKPLGYLRDYAYAALEPERMGLGPIYATSKLLDSSGVSMKDIKLIELNEAFAAQVIANERAFDSDEFSKKFLGKDKKLGALDRDSMNVNGGAIALGHPVGMTGTRIVITLLKEMHRRNVALGLSTLCIGGGQGAALLLEAA